MHYVTGDDLHFNADRSIPNHFGADDFRYYHRDSLDYYSMVLGLLLDRAG